MGEPKDDVKGLDRYGEKRRPWVTYDDEGTPVGFARVNTSRCDPRCSTSPGRCVHRVPVCLSLEHRLAMAKEADAEAEQHRLYRLRPGPRPRFEHDAERAAEREFERRLKEESDETT